MPDPLLSARNLSKTFHVPGGALHAVSDVSFDVFPNETLALVGESGCGKSTLSRVLLHLERPEAGSIIFEGKDITHVPHKDLREVRLQLQYIFQDPYSSLNPRMSVRDIIAEPLVINSIGTPSERENTVDSLLALVGLQQKDADLFPHQFSGGQRQRIAIARALVLNPKLVICDEPVSALDVSMQAQILNLLQDLQDRLRLSYLFISHNLAVVHYISRRVMIMFLGKICEIADTETIFSKPRHPYTNFLLAATPPVDPTRRDEKKMFLQGEIPSPLHLPTGCLFHTRCPYAKEICTTTAPALVHDEARDASFACHFPLN